VLAHGTHQQPLENALPLIYPGYTYITLNILRTKGLFKAWFSPFIIFLVQPHIFSFQCTNSGYTQIVSQKMIYVKVNFYILYFSQQNLPPYIEISNAFIYVSILF